MSYDFHYLKKGRGSRLEKLKKYVIALIKDLNWDDSKIDVSQDWVLNHLLTASQLAKVLAIKRGVDIDLASSAGVLHDIGLIVNNGFENDHAPNGYNKAKEILTEVGGYSEEEKELISNAVAKHSEKDKVGNWLDELIKDVDVLDCALHGMDYTPHNFHLNRVKNLEDELGLKLI